MARKIFIVFSLLAVTCAYASDDYCGDNESLNICGRMCEPTCANRVPNPLTCPRIQCSNATSACRCDEGYYRDTVSNLCVLAEDCPGGQTTPACGTNEQLGNCGRICEGTCTDPDLSRCAATSCTGNGCQCKEGYLRNEETDSCIPASTCPPKKCRKHEILAACGRTCEGTCKSPVRPEICNRIRCATQDCRCDLENGYVRNENTGECIRIRDCPAKGPTCPPNSEPKLCGSICESTCRDPRERLCKIDPSTCTVDCRCLKGYVRDEKTNKCVKPENCCRK